MEGAGRTAAGRRLGAVHREHGCQNIPAPRQGKVSFEGERGRHWGGGLVDTIRDHCMIELSDTDRSPRVDE